MFRGFEGFKVLDDGCPMTGDGLVLIENELSVGYSKPFAEGLSVKASVGQSKGFVIELEFLRIADIQIEDTKLTVELSLAYHQKWRIQ